MLISPLLPFAPPVSGIANIQRAQFFQTRQSDVKQLGEALQSGDLAGAELEFGSIQTLAQSGPLDGKAFSVVQREQDFTAIGRALQSGDLAGAQQAFAQLESTFKPNEVSVDQSSANQNAANQSAPDPGPATVLSVESATAQTNGVNLIA
jgi:hypothetical protein